MNGQLSKKADHRSRRCMKRQRKPHLFNHSIEGRKIMRVSAEIEQRLAGTLAPVELEVVDESDRHRGHAGARPQGESHFRVRIVAPVFAGRSRLERQRMVYAALGELMQTEIHALAIAALTPDEAARSGPG